MQDEKSDESADKKDDPTFSSGRMVCACVSVRKIYSGMMLRKIQEVSVSPMRVYGGWKTTKR